MTIRMVSLLRCAEICGLMPHETIAGVSPSERHERMLLRYLGRRRAATGAGLVAEIREAVEMEAFGRAADLLIVLRAVLAQTGDSRQAARRRRAPVRLARARWRPNFDYFLQELQERELPDGVVAPFSRVARLGDRL